MSASAGGFTKVFCKWTWILTVSAFIDTAHFSLSDYALYQGFLWGKYALCSKLELDFGFLLEVGLNKDKIWPVLGFIYSPTDRIRLHAIYPIDMILEYDLLPKVTIAGAVRILRNRHRVGEDQPLSQGIFQYQTWGAEFDAKYSPFKWFFIKGFVGSTLGGDLKITNRDDNYGHHYKFDPSFFAGANAVLSF